MLVLQQQIKSDNLIPIDQLMQGLQNIEQYLATYPRFMTDYLTEVVEEN